MLNALYPPAISDRLFMVDRQLWATERQDAAAAGNLRAVTFYVGKTLAAGPFDCEVQDKRLLAPERCELDATITRGAV